MQKKYLIIFILLPALVLIAGCSKNTETFNNQGGNQNQNQQEAQNNEQAKWNENFIEANLDDLKINSYVMVMGATNSDGSIVAEQITIGQDKESFENMVAPIEPAMNNGGDEQNNDNQPMDSSAGSNRDRPNFEQMQNMSEEERMKFMEEMRAQREAGGGGIPRANMRSGMTRISGEIIDKDETTITLKVMEGGSKLIFFSNSTRVSMFNKN